MRHAALAFAMLAAASAAARADDDDTDPDFIPQHRLSIGAAAVGHWGRFGALTEQGAGASIELALGDGRWQYLGELGVETSRLEPFTDQPIGAQIVGGQMLRAAAGVRWIARQLVVNHLGAVELYFDGLAGTEHFRWDDGTHLARGELAVGAGMQLRFGDHLRPAWRLFARAVFAPDPGTMAPTVPGFAAGIGLAW